MFSAGPRKENGWLVLKSPEFLDGFRGEVFNRQNLGCRLQGVGLSSDWLVVR